MSDVSLERLTIFLSNNSEFSTEDNVDISSGANMADKLDHPVDHTAEDYKMEVEGDDSSKTKTSSKKKTSKKRGRKRTRTAD